MSSYLGLLEVAAADVPTPPAGKVRFFLDSADGVPSFKDPSGTVTKITSADPELAAIAALTSAADRLPYFTGSGTAALATYTAAARSVDDDATVADMVNTLGGAASTGTGGLVREGSPALTGTPTVPDDAYDATTWNGNFSIPTKNAIRDKIEAGVAPGAHATSHESGGSDPIQLDDLAAPSDNTDLNVSSTAHGLAPKSPGDAEKFLNGAATPAYTTPLESLIIAVSDETTDITTGTAKVTFRMPYAFTLVGLPRASLSDASSSGVVQVDINESGSTIFSTELTIDASEKTSTTAATPCVVSDTSLADDAEMTIDIVAAGTDARGLKVTLIGRRT
jgi:hypothetical protein